MMYFGAAVTRDKSFFDVNSYSFLFRGQHWLHFAEFFVDAVAVHVEDVHLGAYALHKSVDGIWDPLITFNAFRSHISVSRRFHLFELLTLGPDYPLEVFYLFQAGFLKGTELIVRLSQFLPDKRDKQD